MSRPRARPRHAAPALAIIALVGSMLAGCGSSSSKSATSSSGGACSYTPMPSDPGGKHPGIPPATPLQTTGTATATMVTSAGTIVFTMDAAKTPCTLGSFRFLAGAHYFDNTICHRLTTSGIFVLQCGDPAGNGSGGPGYTIPDESLARATYPAGSLAMANTGAPHSGGSQFFLNYQDSPLPASYTPFGTITQGLSVLQGIAKTGTAGGLSDGKPAKTATITGFTVTPPPN